MSCTYELADGVATITMDDGKVNALSTRMLEAVSDQLDRAEADGVAVVLTGARQTFSAGFDLRTEPDGWREMMRAGAGLAERLLSFPRPVIAACNGNAIAMAAFLLLSVDYRVGVRGDTRIGLNEVAIGLTLPWFGLAIARYRLTRGYFDRCTITGALLGPDEARAAGFLDDLVAPDALQQVAHTVAGNLLLLDPAAHVATKARARSEVLAGVRHGIEQLAGPPADW